MENGEVNTIAHFSLELDIPSSTEVTMYTALNKKKDKKNKEKYNKFTYYKVQDSILKVLYRDEKTLLNQGNYPFTAPTGKLESIKSLGDRNPQRLTITEGAYIGHKEKTLYIMKMKDVPVETGKLQLDSDKVTAYETITMGNEERFGQFMKLLGSDPKRSEMSVRVMINETDADKPQVIDYEFFYREEEIKRTKAFATQLKE